jgi:hypothetical protein
LEYHLKGTEIFVRDEIGIVLVEPNGWMRRENPFDRKRGKGEEERKTVKSAFSIFRKKTKKEKSLKKSLT